MKNQWNKVIIICKDSEILMIFNDKIHTSNLRPQYQLQEQNSIRRASKIVRKRPF